MNKLETLRAYLQGSSIQDAPWADWATNHAPLKSPSIHTLSGRRLNHFCVGSDPEFAFSDPGRDHKINATDLGLKVGLAAGCDQNERLVELRPFPSPSVVKHVAGILTCLRWMSRVYGRYTNQLTWRSGAFFDGDGMGGHVHFGRKRPSRPEEVKALDGLARVFRGTGLFNNAEWDRRIRGDNIGQRYGVEGDFRVQAHGYEYRSLPSWLQSPLTAFIAVCASKLAVFDPEVTSGWKTQTQPVCRDLLRGLAKLYRSRDDDAYLMYHVLTAKGDLPFVIDLEADFKKAWGLDKAPLNKAEERYILPASIEPTEVEVNQIQDYLLNGTPINYIESPAAFKHSLPNGYLWIPKLIGGRRLPGFGDLLHNMACHENHVITLQQYNGDAISIVGGLADIWDHDDVLFMRRYAPLLIKGGNKPQKDGVTSTDISVPRMLCTTTEVSGLRGMLFDSGLFPLWRVAEVEADSYSAWESVNKSQVKKSWRVV